MCFLRFLTCKQVILGLFLFDLGTFIGGVVALTTPTSEIASKFRGAWLMVLLTTLWCIVYMAMDIIMFRNVIPEDVGDEEAQRRKEGNILHSGIWLLVILQFVGSIFLLILHAACNNSEALEMIKETRATMIGSRQGTNYYSGGDFGTFFQFSNYCIFYCVAKMLITFACCLSTERNKYTAIPDK